MNTLSPTTVPEGVLTHEARAYTRPALRAVANLWREREGEEHSGDRRVRALFRRWRPDRDGKPSPEMLGAVLNVKPPDGESDIPSTWWIAPAERAAVVVALRAAAGDEESGAEKETGEQKTVRWTTSLGAALYRAGLSDHRFARVVTAPPHARLEALHRALRRVDRESAGPIAWTVSEVRHILFFLFGDAEAARKATDAWAADFFRARAGTPPADADSSTNSNPTEA